MGHQVRATYDATDEGRGDSGPLGGEGDGSSRRPECDPMSSPVVLILAHPADVHADAVQAHLDAAGVRVRRIDTAGLGSLAAPVTAYLNGGAVTGDVAGVSLARVVGVWHRRPSQFPTSDERDAAELGAGVGGILAALPYLNHPADMAVAGFKPYQPGGAGGGGRSGPSSPG